MRRSTLCQGGVCPRLPYLLLTLLSHVYQQLCRTPSGSQWLYQIVRAPDGPLPPRSHRRLTTLAPAGLVLQKPLHQTYTFSNKTSIPSRSLSSRCRWKNRDHGLLDPLSSAAHMSQASASANKGTCPYSLRRVSSTAFFIVCQIHRSPLALAHVRAIPLQVKAKRRRKRAARQ